MWNRSFNNWTKTAINLFWYERLCALRYSDNDNLLQYFSPVFLILLIHSADPQSRPVGIIFFTPVVRTSVRTSPLFKSRNTKQILSENNVHYWWDYVSGWVDHWWHISHYETIDPWDRPQSWPVVITIFAHVVRPSVQKIQNQAAGIVGLTEWIIDDTCLIMRLFFSILFPLSVWMDIFLPSPPPFISHVFVCGYYCIFLC